MTFFVGLYYFEIWYTSCELFPKHEREEEFPNKLRLESLCKMRKCSATKMKLTGFIILVISSLVYSLPFNYASNASAVHLHTIRPEIWQPGLAAVSLVDSIKMCDKHPTSQIQQTLFQVRLRKWLVHQTMQLNQNVVNAKQYNNMWKLYTFKYMGKK